MSSHLNISAAQRVDMIQRGLNPLNPTHVQNYLHGNKRANINENIERVKAIMGDKLNSSLGHGRENDKDPVPGQEYNGGNFAQNNNVQSMRQNMVEDMDDYVNQPMRSTDELMSFDPPVAPRNNNKASLQEAAASGKTLAVNYFNAFIQSLQQPSTQAHMKVYKALRALLEQEGQLKNNPALPHFQKSVSDVTGQMYKRITKQLND